MSDLGREWWAVLLHRYIAEVVALRRLHEPGPLRMKCRWIVGCPQNWPWQSRLLLSTCWIQHELLVFGRSAKVSPGTLSMFQTSSHYLETNTVTCRYLHYIEIQIFHGQRTSLAGCLRLILLRNHVRVHVKHPQSSQSQLLTCYYPLWLRVNTNHPKMGSSHPNKDTYFAHLQDWPTATCWYGLRHTRHGFDA